MTGIKTMNKTVFDRLSKKMIKNLDSRKAVELYLFGGRSAYQAEIEVFGHVAVVVKKIADRMQNYYQECLNVSMLSDRPKMHLVSRSIILDSLGDIEVFVYVSDGSITALQSVDTGRDLSELIDVPFIYDEIEEKLLMFLENKIDNFNLDI
jgi:hypothetical protein